MLLILNKYKNFFNQCWRWWVSEIFELMPGHLNFPSRDLRPTTIFRVEGDEIFLISPSNKTSKVAKIVREKGQYNFHTEMEGDGAAPECQGHRIEVELGRDYVFNRQISLPVMSDDDARDAINLTIEREIPLDRSSCYEALQFEQQKEPYPAKHVIFSIARKRFVDRLLTYLNSLQYVPDTIYAEPKSPREKRAVILDIARKREEGEQRLVRLLMLSFISLLVIGLSAASLRLDRINHSLDEKIAVARENIATIDAKQQQLQEIQKRLQFLGQVTNVPTIAVALEALSALLPDDVWVKEMRKNDDQITLIGTSKDLGSVISLLEASPLFQQVELKVLNQSLEASNVNTFEIRLTLAARGDDT